jgi:hypothetical protein
MTAMRRVLLVALGLLATAGRADATTIIYSVQLVGSGSLGEHSFTNQRIWVDAFADTDDVVNAGDGVFQVKNSLVLFTLNFDGGGGASGQFSLPRVTLIRQFDETFTLVLGTTGPLAAAFLDVQHPDFATYDLKGPIGPLSGTPTIYPAQTFPTAGFGDLVVTSTTGAATFQAKRADVTAAATFRNFTGKATYVGRGPRSGISMVATFTPDRPLDLDAARTVTIAHLLGDGTGDVAGLPLTLDAGCCNSSKTAYFETAGSSPRARVTLGAKGRGEYTLRIDVSQASTEPSVQCPDARLLTALLIHDGGPAPAFVATQQPWLCFGQENVYLKSPR